MFRFKSSIPVAYDRQGYIYFYSRRYRKLPASERESIRAACEEAGGPYAKAVLEFVTTDKGAVYICGKHYLSEKTLERAVKRYYITMDRTLK